VLLLKLSKRCPLSGVSAHGPPGFNLTFIRKSLNASCVGDHHNKFRVTHPFHPLLGMEYELVTRKLTWGEDRVFYYDQTGTLSLF